MYGFLWRARTERAAHSETEDCKEHHHHEREDETEDHVGFCRGTSALMMDFRITHKTVAILRTQKSEVREKVLDRMGAVALGGGICTGQREEHLGCDDRVDAKEPPQNASEPVSPEDGEPFTSPQ